MFKLFRRAENKLVRAVLDAKEDKPLAGHSRRSWRRVRARLSWVWDVNPIGHRRVAPVRLEGEAKA